MFAGNDQLRNMATTMRDRYMVSSKKEKSAMSRELVQKVQALSPPGRFLKRENVTAAWVEVDMDAAREKASQCLRDAVTLVKKKTDDKTPTANKDINSSSNSKSTKEKRKERSVAPVTPPRSRSSTPKIEWEASPTDLEMPPLEIVRGSKRPRIGTWEVETKEEDDLDVGVMDFVHTIPTESDFGGLVHDIAPPENWLLFSESFLVTENIDYDTSENTGSDEEMDPFTTAFF